MKKFLAKSQTVSSDAPMGKTCLRPFWRSQASSFSASALTSETSTLKRADAKNGERLRSCSQFQRNYPAQRKITGVIALIGDCAWPLQAGNILALFS